MKTYTSAATAKIGDTIKVVCGNVWDTDGAKILEAIVVGEIDRPYVGRQVMCIHDMGFMYMVTELSKHSGYHYCTAGFNFASRWHKLIAREGDVSLEQVKEWADMDLSKLSRIESIVDEEVLDKYLGAVDNSNDEKKSLVSEENDIN